VYTVALLFHIALFVLLIMAGRIQPTRVGQAVALQSADV
jgi:hypothetical protein